MVEYGQNRLLLGEPNGTHKNVRLRSRVICKPGTEIYSNFLSTIQNHSK